jgi:hypothetical protein
VGIGLFSAVACFLRDCSSIGVDDFLVVLANNSFHVFRAAVT